MNVSVKKIQSKSAQTESNTTTWNSHDFEAIFNAQWDRVYGVVYSIVGDPAEAQDLVLESFLRLHQRPPRHETNLSGWLYRVATNLAFNALRAKKRRAGYEVDAGKIVMETSAAVNPGKAVEQKEEHDRVRQVLSGMKRRSAKILILRHSGFSYKEIAAAVGVSTSSVGTLLARAEQEFESRYRKD